MALPVPLSLLRECRASVGNSVTGPVFFDHVRRRGLPVLRSPKHITAPIPPDLHERAIIAPEVYWTWSLVWRLDEARAAVPVVVEALSAGVGDLDLHRAVPALSSSCRLVFGRSSWVTSAWSEGARWALPVENYSIESGRQNVGAWQSCDDCVALLERSDWDGLTRRAFAATRQCGRTDGLDRAMFEEMYRQLCGHDIGRVHLSRL